MTSTMTMTENSTVLAEIEALLSDTDSRLQQIKSEQQIRAAEAEAALSRYETYRAEVERALAYQATITSRLAEARTVLAAADEDSAQAAGALVAELDNVLSKTVEIATTAEAELSALEAHPRVAARLAQQRAIQVAFDEIVAEIGRLPYAKVRDNIIASGLSHDQKASLQRQLIDRCVKKVLTQAIHGQPDEAIAELRRLPEMNPEVQKAAIVVRRKFRAFLERELRAAADELPAQAMARLSRIAGRAHITPGVLVEAFRKAALAGQYVYVHKPLLACSETDAGLVVRFSCKPGIAPVGAIWDPAAKVASHPRVLTDAEDASGARRAPEGEDVDAEVTQDPEPLVAELVESVDVGPSETDCTTEPAFTTFSVRDLVVPAPPKRVRAKKTVASSDDGAALTDSIRKYARERRAAYVPSTDSTDVPSEAPKRKRTTRKVASAEATEPIAAAA